MVYVDDYKAKFGRYVMCHMSADSEEELDGMAQRIGLELGWKQKNPRRPVSHYDVSESKKRKAIELGAKEVTSRELVLILSRRGSDATTIHG